MGDISWTTADIHNLMACLQIKVFEKMVVLPNCQLSYLYGSTLNRPVVKVTKMMLATTLLADTLAALLSHIEVDELLLHEGFKVQHTNGPKVLDMVRQYNLQFSTTFQSIFEYQIINIITNVMSISATDRENWSSGGFTLSAELDIILIYVGSI